MSYGKLTQAQMRAVHGIVKGRVVTDIGAGNGHLSVALVGLGAAEVIAVDRDLVSLGTLPKVRPVIAHFCEYKEEIDVAFMSWPPQYGAQGLAEAAARAETVIYLGSNVDGSVCGPNDLWQVLRFREVLVYLPDRKNTLLVYGRKEGKRPLMPEEFAALNMERIWGFDELHGNRAKSGALLS